MANRGGEGARRRRQWRWGTGLGFAGIVTGRARIRKGGEKNEAAARNAKMNGMWRDARGWTPATATRAGGVAPSRTERRERERLTGGARRGFFLFFFFFLRAVTILPP